MKRLSAVLLVFITSFLSYHSTTYAQSDQQKEYNIKEITVSGIQFLDPNAIINLSGLKVGDKLRIPSTDAATAIKKLWKTGLFGDVSVTIAKVEGDDIFLDINLQERPKVTRISFDGVRKGQQTTLSEKLGTIKGTVVSDATLKNAELTIKKYYAEKGYYNSTVKIIQTKDTLLRNGVALDFYVDKGPKVKVKSINIEGNTKIADKKIRKKMKIKEKKPVQIFTSSKFVRKKFEEDKAKIVDFLNNRGYRDARITEDTVYSVNRKRVNISLTLQEGTKYYFRNITWTGNYKYTDEALGRVLGIKKGDVYNKKELEERLNFSFTQQDVSSLYMDDGYLFFRINPIEVAVEGDSIDVEMRIYEGPQANIDAIYINGNTRTSDHVIQREIRTIPGQKFSRQNIIRTQQALSQLGYFDPEKIQIEPVPHIETGTVDIIYNLEERPSDQLELSGGWGGAIGFVGTLGVVFNNFSIRKAGRLSNWRPVPTGDGQRLAVRVQANGRQFQTYSLTFTEPWLGGKKPNSFTVNLSHSVQRRVINGEVIGTLLVTGATVSLGRRLKKPDDYFVLSNAISYQAYQLDNFAVFSSDFTDGVSNNINFNTTISRNSINNPTFPRSGSSVSLSVSLTPPFSLFDNIEGRQGYEEQEPAERFQWIEYHKWMFDASFFTPVAGKLVLNTRVHFGFLNAYNRDKGVGPFERFTMGGAGLAGQNFILGTDIIGLRGYQDNSIVPIAFSDDDTGGTVFNKYVMEFRYPISLNPAATIFILGFLEGGNNWGSFDQFDPFNVYRSAGFGARIFMPAFGLIGLDYGIGFDDVPGSPEANGPQFHFTIGQQIR